MTNKAALVSALLGASMVATPAIAMATTYDVGAPQDTNVVAEMSQKAMLSQYVTADASEGTFEYTQQNLTPNSVIRDVFMRHIQVLCGASDGLDIVNADEWQITVSGDVNHPYMSTIGELKEDCEQTVVMGCTCASNTADGRASVTAKVTGVDLATLIMFAQPVDGANAVTLYSEDGYKMVLPLSFVLDRDAVISYTVNDEPLSESVGGTNQLWINGAAAKFFTRNITDIVITAEEIEPAMPGEEVPNDGEYQNRPNVALTSSEVGR